MTPDITIKDYYLKYIYIAKSDIVKYNKESELIKEIKNNILEYLTKEKDNLEHNFNIIIDDLNKDYKKLYNKYCKVLESEEVNNKVLLLQLIKYCKACIDEDKNNKLINLANKRKDLKFRQFQNYVALYYNKVHKCVLEGMGYKYGYGIGTYCCNYWKLTDSGLKKKVLDYAATRAKKKELLAAGIKTYDDNEAAWYKARGIPYDGVDYRVYKNKTHYYEFVFMNSRISRSVPYNYNRTEYANIKYKKISQQQIAEDYCKTIDDIYDLQVDIKCKLNILLYKEPNKYLNFIRNVEQYKYKHRAYNSENR